MIIVNNNNICNVANNITVNSEMFADETLSVTAQLTDLVNSANKFGCKITGAVRNCWGTTIDVIACPDSYKNSWTF